MCTGAVLWFKPIVSKGMAMISKDLLQLSVVKPETIAKNQSPNAEKVPEYNLVIIR
jgi:hypothetical protein